MTAKFKPFTLINPFVHDDEDKSIPMVIDINDVAHAIRRNDNPTKRPYTLLTTKNGREFFVAEYPAILLS